jgi:uncharacterized protein (DUF2252 family)
MRKVPHPTLEERTAQGRNARKATPRSSHAGWEPAADRSDPVALLEEQNARREPDLVPVRHGRMLASAFAFYRGGARIMAEDLASTPTAGLTVQLCGDAHLSNFGVFASPERNLVFDLNDFDETLPGPFEWDLKRLAASVTIAGRENGYAAVDVRAATTASVRGYREAMVGFAGMRTLDVWYAHLSEDELISSIDQEARRARKAGIVSKKQAEKFERGSRAQAAKARTRDSMQALAKLAEKVDGRYRIASSPPTVVPARDLEQALGIPEEALQEVLNAQFRDYRATLQDDRRRLLERFQIVDVARKVVGVGSVGTRAFIGLLLGRDENDPLFLQVKEATRSVLEEHLPKSTYRHPGERVVQGQRLMQAVSDSFLGWTKGVQDDRYFYWRQLRDMKGSADVASLTAESLMFYARLCGWTLARAHARSGDPVAIAAYLGGGDVFDRAVVDFAERYADRNEQDFNEFSKAVESGRIQAVLGV